MSRFTLCLPLLLLLLLWRQWRVRGHRRSAACAAARRWLLLLLLLLFRCYMLRGGRWRRGRLAGRGLAVEGKAAAGLQRRSGRLLALPQRG